MYSSLILAAAKSVGVPGALLLAICTQESSLVNIVVPDDNGAPSYGICQLQEDTARSMGYSGIATGPLKPSERKLFKGAMEPDGKPQGLMIPKTNARYAAKYLKKQLDRYDWDFCHAVAAYNAGTYTPSPKLPGKPRNYKYVKAVTLRLDEEHKDMLICGPRKVQQE